MAERFSCSFCGRLAPDGLRVHGELICRACETRLIRLKSDDKDYGGWVLAIRSLWNQWSGEADGLCDPSEDGERLSSKTPDHNRPNPDS